MRSTVKHMTQVGCEQVMYNEPSLSGSTNSHDFRLLKCEAQAAAVGSITPEQRAQNTSEQPVFSQDPLDVCLCCGLSCASSDWLSG